MSEQTYGILIHHPYLPEVISHEASEGVKAYPVVRLGWDVSIIFDSWPDLDNFITALCDGYNAHVESDLQSDNERFSDAT